MKMFETRLRWAVVALVLVCLGATQSALAQKRIAYIRNNTSPRYATHDANMIRVLGTAGITVSGVTIPGLRYQITEYQQGAEPDPITASVADLIFISETVDSGTPRYHTDDPLPLINGEQALMNDDAPPRSEMYFSDGSAASATDAVFDFQFTNNTHPITSIFPLGRVRMWNTGQMGSMIPPMATCVTVLAVDPGTPANPCLAVAEAGATPFRPGGIGNDPAPARRVNLGFHEDTMSNPTTSGVYLVQRTFQWAIGDPVTAGPQPTQPPTAPSGLTAQAVGQDRILLNWVDNSNSEQGFRIERRTTATTYAEIAQTAANATSYMDTGVTPLTTYTYRVRAFNAVGNSAYSNEASATTVFILGVRRWFLYRD